MHLGLEGTSETLKFQPPADQPLYQAAAQGTQGPIEPCMSPEMGHPQLPWAACAAPHHPPDEKFPI